MKKEKIKTQVDSSQKIPFTEMLAYGSAEIYGGGSATLISLVLLFYLNIILGISAAWAGAIILVSKAWDAISDPLMGVISDNTRSKWGRRKPYMVAGGIMTFFSMLFLFAPIQDLPEGWKVAIAMIAYIFFCTSNTVSQVPFCSLAADISESHSERNKANTVKLGFSMIGAAVCFLVPSMLMDKIIAPKGVVSDGAAIKTFLYIGVIFAFVFAIPLIISGLFTKERAHYNKEIKAKFSFKSYLEPFKVKSYRWHLVMYICAFLCMDLISALVFYYVAIIASQAPPVTLFGKETTIGSSMIVAPMMIMAALFIPLVLVIAKKKSKQFAFRLGLPLYILGGVMLALYQTNWSPWLIPVFSIIMGIGIAGAQSMPWMIFPDTVDAAALKLKTKPTGTFSGLMTFSRKLTQAISIFLVGVIFEAIGIYKGADGKISIKHGEKILSGAEEIAARAQATKAIRILIIVVVGILISTAFIASIMYKLDTKKLDRIKYFLDKQNEDPTDSNLTEEEKKEKEFFIKKYS